MGAVKSKRVPRAVREQQMLDAAVLTFARRGYRAASMDEIAEVAGVSKPLVYLYLNSKEELFSAVIRRERAALVAAVTAAVQPGRRPTASCGTDCRASSRTPRNTRRAGPYCTSRPARTASPSHSKSPRCGRRSSPLSRS